MAGAMAKQSNLPSCMKNEDVILILTTCPDNTVAHAIAESLVSERLAACVNEIPSLTSTYLWQGQMRHDAEVLLLIKTTAGRLAELEVRLLALHPYELPELLVLPVSGGSSTY